jgi:hypothetical protein
VTTLRAVHPLLQPTRRERIVNRAIDIGGAMFALYFVGVIAVFAVISAAWLLGLVTL